jgi:hypothetical protein
MARIRTVKPEFFRHENLQALGPLSMLIFEGLWTQCDKAGRFPWKPRMLKLDILPFIDFDMETELKKLAESFFIVKYESQGEFFGVVPTFLEHQRISGKELQEPARFPDPPQGKPRKLRKLPVEKTGTDWEATGKHPGSTGDQLESQEKEGKGKGIGKGKEREAAKKYFESARLLYPGNRNGLESEWDNFEKKNPEYDEILPLLIPAIEREIAHKAALKASNQFCAEWKNFQTWINKRCWTQEFGEVGAAPRRPAFGAPPPTREQLEKTMDAVFNRAKGNALGL